MSEIMIPLRETKEALMKATFAEVKSALGISAKVDSTEKGAASGVATLGADGKLPLSQLPERGKVSVHVVTSEAAMLALDVQEGDIAIRSDLPATFYALNSDNSALTDWAQAPIPTDAVLSVNGETGAVSITAASLGLGDVLTDITASENDIAALQAEVATKASTSALNAVAANVTTNTANIATNTTDIAASEADIEANTNAITANTANITANSAAIATKADSSALASTDANVSTNTANIAANAASIATKADSSALASTDANVSANATEISGKSSKLSPAMVSANHTASEATYMMADTENGGFTITLPDSSVATDKVVIYKINTENDLSIIGHNGQEVMGESTLTLTVKERIELYPLGSMGWG